MINNENNIKFALALDKINKKIAKLNIKLSKDLTNPVLKNELDLLLKDKKCLYTGTDVDELTELINKYGSKDNE